MNKKEIQIKDEFIKEVQSALSRYRGKKSSLGMSKTELKARASKGGKAGMIKRWGKDKSETKE